MVVGGWELVVRVVANNEGQEFSSIKFQMASGFFKELGESREISIGIRNMGMPQKAR